MEPLINTAIDNLINIDDPVSPAYLKLQLDVLYKQSVQIGLNNIQLQKIIEFLCITNLISNETKLYIIRNCLFPCEHIEKPVIATIVNNLGVPTIYSPYQLTLKHEIQEALCEWLVKVYFIIGDDVEIDNSVWIHLWQFSYLQKWLTYILIWSTRSINQIKNWKIQLIKKIALKSSYKDGKIFAVLILKKFQELVGYSQLISDAIVELNTPIRKVQSFEKLNLQTKLFRQTCEILITTSPDKFNNEDLIALVENLKNQLIISNHFNETYTFISNKSGQTNTISEAISAKQLVQNWNSNKLKVGNLIAEFQDTNRTLNVFELVRILGASNITYLNDILCDIMKLQVDFLFHSSDIRLVEISKLVIRLRLFSNLVPRIGSILRESYLQRDNLGGNKMLFELVFGFNPILNHYDFEDFEVVQKKVFQYTTAAISIENKNEKNYEILPLVVTRLFFDIFNRIESNKNPVDKDIMRLFSKLGNLTFNRITDNSLRFFDVAGATYYMTVLNRIFSSNSLYEHIPSIILEPGKLKCIVLQHDPILLNVLCGYLVLAKGSIATNMTKKESIKIHNQFLLDLTNYLWRNKISNSDSIFDIPTVYIESVVKNLYLPGISRKDKAVFSLTGIPATSIIFYSQLRKAEVDFECKVKYDCELTSAGFKKFISTSNNKENWIPKIKDYDDLKRYILKSMAGLDGFNEIALFLYTFIKSLTASN